MRKNYKSFCIVAAMSMSLTGALVSFAQADGYQDATKAIEEKNYEAAFEIYSNLADSGEAEAKDSLAVFYVRGIGGAKKDLAKAETLWQEAAEAQYLPSLYNLGVHYLTNSTDKAMTMKAYMWLFIANARGKSKAREGMELADKSLSENDIRKARKAAFFCIKQQFKGCKVD